MAQERVHCEECKRFLLSIWPQGTHELVIATGEQLEGQDAEGRFLSPGPMTTGGITFSRAPDRTVVRVRCPDCRFGGADVIMQGRPRPKPARRGRWANAWAALLGR